MLSDIIGHDEIKSKLKKLSSNPPKVLLFTGPEGVGKKHTALNYVDEIHNGYLKGKLFTHPDIYILEPQTKVFKLELIDKLKHGVSTTPFELKRKFFILNQVDLMNKESANACLKIFEDCPDFIHFILLAENPDNVLDTIKSRSMSFGFTPIPNLKEHYPMLSDLELKVMGGCLGKRELLKEHDLKFIYDDVSNFINNFNQYSYAEIMEWCLSKESYDIEFLTDLLFIACEDMYKQNKNIFISEILLDKLKSLKDKIPLNLNLKMHFKDSLLQAKHSLEKLN